MDKNSILPENTHLFPHQIAGHIHGTGDTKLGLLKHANGCILKPGKKEIEFYEQINDARCVNKDILFLRMFTPAYRGVWEANVFGKKVQYVMIEDITDQFIKPSILDVKIGAITYDPEASSEKIKRESAKYPASTIIGFRILGMRVYQHATNSYLVLGKEFGKHQTPESVISALHTFMDNQSGPQVQEILQDILNRLTSLERWFSTQQQLAFYSSSLLLVYEASKLVPSQINGTTNFSKISDVRMIDFAHVFPHTECDANYVFGLNKFINALKELLSNV